MNQQLSSQQAPQAKKAYEAPALTELGSVEQLTEAATEPSGSSFKVMPV